MEPTTNGISGQKETAEEALMKQATLLNLLLEVSNDVVSVLDLRDLLRAVSSSIRRILQCPGVGVLLPEPGGEYLRYYGFDAMEDFHGPPDTPIPLEASPAAGVLRTGRPFILNPIPRETTPFWPYIPGEVDTIIEIPLTSRKRTLGVLVIALSNERQVSANELSVLCQVANQITIGIENSLAYEEIAELKDKLAQEKLYLAETQRLSHTGSWAWDLHEGDPKITHWSEELFRIWEFDPQEGLPTIEKMSRRIHPEDLDRVKVALEQTIRNKMDTFDEIRIVQPGGTFKYIQMIRHPILNGAGDVVKLIGTSVDITERKRAEEALRESERKYRELVEHASSIILHWQRDGRIIHLNEFGRRFFGYTESEIHGRHVIGTIVPEIESSGRDLSRLMDEIRANPSAFEQSVNENMRRNGERVWIAWTNKVLLNPKGEVTEILSVGMDITARRLMEEELRLMHFSLEHASDAVYGMDSQGHIVFVNEAACRSLSCSQAEVLTLSILDVNPTFSAELWRSTWEKLKLQGSITLETFHRSKEDRIFPVELTCNYLDFAGKEYAFAFARDITDRKRVEEALRRSETYLAEGQRLTHTGTYAADCTTEPLYWSEELFRIFGYDPQHGLPKRDEPLQRIHPEDLEKFQQAFARATHEKLDSDGEYRILLPDGTVKHIYGLAHPVLNDNGELVEVVGTVIDITERKRAEQEHERLRQLEAELAHLNRVSMMGELAASIAHEVNQPLAGVVSNASACQRWLAGDLPNLEEARETARRIIRDGKRAAEVIARIRALAKRAEMPKERLDLNETIRDVLALIGDQAKKNRVRIRTQFADGLSPVLGDRVQLQQVVLNLVMNAIEAMSPVDERPRELTITTRDVDGGKVLVSVKDSGIGIDTNTLAKIFNPFYTTKPGGMGMGLRISRSIIEAHEGQLWATANDGPGTVFHFTLPKYEEIE